MMERIMDDKTTEKLIKLIKQTEMLWNLRHPDYKNLKRKALAWKWISEQCGVSKDLCKKKWKGLRDTYSREMKQKKLLEQDEGDQTHWWKYRESMAFIKEQLQRRNYTKTVSNNPFEDCSDSASETFPEMSNDGDKEISFNYDPDTQEYGESSLSFSPRGLKEQKNIVEEEDQKIDFDFITCTSEPEDTYIRASATRADKKQTIKKINFDFISEVDDTGPTSYSARKRQKVSLGQSIASTMKSVQDHLAKPCQTIQIVSSPSSLNPEDEFFCRSLVEKLSKFPLREKNTAKIELMQYLCEKEAELSECN